MATEVSSIEAKFTADISDIKSKLDIVTTQMTKVKTTTGDMAKGFALGTAAINVASKAISALGGFLESSVQGGLKEQATMALVANNVKNAGVSYDSIKGKLEEYSSSMTKMGFDNEETASSVSKLMLVTKNYDNALKMNQLAMDLSRNKNMDLETATKMVTLAGEGNTKMLKTYGIELSKGASGAQALDELQKKLKGSAEAYANTAQGKLASVNAQWDDAKKKVGEQLIPVLSQLMSKVSDNMPAITNLMVSFGDAIAKCAGVVMDLANAWNVWSNTATTSIDKTLESNLDEVAKRFNENQAKLKHTTELTGKDIAAMPIEEQKKLFEEFGKGAATAANKLEKLKLSASNVDFSGTGKGAADTSKKIADAIKKANESLTSFVTNLNDTVKKHKDALEKVNQDTITAKKDFDKANEDAAKSYADSLKQQDESNKDSLASIIKTHQDKVNTLKQQLLDETQFGQNQDEVKIADTKQQLAQELAFLNKHSSEVSKVQSLLGEDEIDKQNRLNNEKLANDKAKYDEETAKRKSEYEQKTIDLKKQLDDENTAYNDSLAKIGVDFKDSWTNIINWVKTKATPDMVSAFKEMSTQANKEISKLGISGAVSVPSVSANITGKKQHAMGGMIGETGLHLLHAGEQVISRNNVEGGKGVGHQVSINFYGGMSISKEADENRLADKIRKVMMNDLQLASKGLY